MVDLLILIAGLTGIILFWATIKKATQATDGVLSMGINVVNTVSTTSNDSLKVYARDITILNAKKKTEQAAEIAKLGDIPTDDELDALLAGHIKPTTTV